MNWKPKHSSLYLGNNRISPIESGSFNGLGYLKYLHLDRNRLTTLKVGMFNGLAVVETLSLGNNYINYIDDYAFANMKKLKVLLLVNNALVVLRPKMFSRLDSLRTLGLVENPLTTLSSGVFNHLPWPLELAITDLDDYGNPFGFPMQCDVKLCWLRQEELQGTITWYRTHPICRDDTEWSNSICDETGSASLAALFTPSTLQHNCSICGRQTIYFVAISNSDLKDLLNIS